MAKVLLEPIHPYGNMGQRRAYIFCPGCYGHAKAKWPDDSAFWINYALHCLIVSGEGAWEFNQDFEAPTFSPSVLSRGEIVCHSFIAGGKMQYLNDCTHGMANQTVELLGADMYTALYPGWDK